MIDADNRPKNTPSKDTPSKDTLSMSCEEFQQRLPELFESGDDLSADPHLSTCENCSALVQDLQYIAQQAKLLLPLHDPSPEVWDNIQNALKKEPSGAKFK